MLQATVQSKNKQDYQCFLVFLFMLFLVFVKCYMVFVQPKTERAYQKTQQQIDHTTVKFWEYPKLIVSQISK